MSSGHGETVTEETMPPMIHESMKTAAQPPCTTPREVDSDESATTGMPSASPTTSPRPTLLRSSSPAAGSWLGGAMAARARHRTTAGAMARRQVSPHTARSLPRR